jgi:transposase
MVSEVRSSAKTEGIDRINPRSAGIDVGSRTHYVAVDPERAEKPVRSFGCYTPDLRDMASWLLECGVTTVAMESTGVYWVPVYQVLQEYGLDVKLVDARQVKNVPGRKTDVVDCQWIQRLHSYGLLRGCFLPEAEIAPLREYWRHRASLVELASREILHIQKSMEQMNLHLHKVLSDIMGVSGMKMIRAIVAGERNPAVLAAMRDARVKMSELEIVKALTGNYRQECLFTLRQALELYDLLQEKIKECDEKIQEYLSEFIAKADKKDMPEKKRKGNRRKNQPHFDLGGRLYEITGVDLTAIDGIEASTALTVIAETGFDLSCFPTEKHYASWLTLCPENRITGGKVKKRGTRKSQNEAAVALRLAAQSLHHSSSALGAFFRRIKARSGTAKAITATARKLACLIYRMLRFGMTYVDAGQQEYERRYQEQQIKALRARAASLGYTVVCLETGQVS